MSHSCWGNRCRLGPLRGPADETLAGDGVNIGAVKESHSSPKIQITLEQGNGNRAAVMEFAAVVRRINTQSKYCSAGPDPSPVLWIRLGGRMSVFHSSMTTSTQTWERANAERVCAQKQTDAELHQFKLRSLALATAFRSTFWFNIKFCSCMVLFKYQYTRDVKPGTSLHRFF